MDFTTTLPKPLKQEIDRIIAKTPEARDVFNNLYNHLTGVIKQPKIQQESNGGNKKRKIETVDNLDNHTVLENISISAPERRRFNMIFHDNHISIAKQLDPLNIEYTFAIADITACLLLHVPDKAKPQYSLLMFTEKSSEPCLQATLMVDKAQTVLRQPSPNNAIQEYMTNDFVVQVLKRELQLDDKVFDTSQDKVCSTAYRGSKEGYLFLLDKYIFFGFKKPVLLFAHSQIESVTYSNVARVTFNMTIKLNTPLSGNPGLEYEFSMIDHEDYDEINEYMESKKFGNASLDESLRAKSTTNEYSNELEKAAQEDKQQQEEKQEEVKVGGLPNGTTGQLAGDPEDDEDEEDDEDFKSPDEDEDEEDVGSDDESDSDDDVE